jgi:hypothetical protein
MWGYSSLLPEESKGESSDDEATSRHVGGGGATRRAGGGATTHISTESSNEASCHEGGGAVWQWLELPTSYIREGGGAVRQRLKLPTSWCEGGGAVRLEGEANLPYWSQTCHFMSSECLLTLAALINVEKAEGHLAALTMTKQKAA